MFSGIINYTATVKKIKKDKNGMELTITAPAIVGKRLKIGSSLNTNGVCLTVIKKVVTSKTAELKMFLMNETLRRTSFEPIKEKEIINIEPSLVIGDEVSGHFVFGHVDAVGKIFKMENDGESIIMSVVVPANLKKYMPVKGSVAIDGISLTLISTPKYCPKNAIAVSLIPHTVNITNLKNKKPGSLVNIEVDMLARYAQSGKGLK